MPIPIPADPLTCLRLASALMLATATAPEHPLVLGTSADLAATGATVDRLIAAGFADSELRARAHELARQWSSEARRLGLRRPRRRRRRSPR